MVKKGSFEIKVGLAEMLKGGVIMDVMNAEQAKIAEASKKYRDDLDDGGARHFSEVIKETRKIIDQAKKDGDSVGGAIYVIQNTNNASFVHPTSNAQQTANRYLQFSEWSQHRPIYGSFTYQTPE